MIAAIGNYAPAAAIGMVITGLGVLVNTFVQRKQRRLDAAAKSQETGQDNSGYWKGETMAMRPEIERLKEQVRQNAAVHEAQLTAMARQHEEQIAKLTKTNERQQREIVLLKVQIADLVTDRDRQTREGRRQTDEGDRQTREGERQTIEGRRLDKIRTDLENNA